MSISDWSVVKRGPALTNTKRDERVTFRNKREVFDDRAFLERPTTVSVNDLKNLSMYAFWRLFDVNKNKLVRKRQERFVALSGTGWPKQADMQHAQHAEYAKRTLFAYMPCAGLSGTEFVTEYVRTHCGDSWGLALFNFVMDPLNRWCPTWITRNYEMQNVVISGLPQLSAPAPPRPPPTKADADDTDDGTVAARKHRIPHAHLYKTKLIFQESGEPAPDVAHETDEANPLLDADDHWDDRTSWQRHSGMGPNVQPTGKLMRILPLEEKVNPPDFNYAANEYGLRLDAVRASWERVGDATSVYSDASLSRDNLGDDFQQLFLRIVFGHVEELILALRHLNPVPAMLRLLLLGTAGTGKTTTVQTTLQEVHQLLLREGLPASFVRVAAPTGCAAFNLRFNATTVHRLIHHFRLAGFQELSDHSLERLQTWLAETRLVFIDEISMLGRQGMGRMDSRLAQGKAGQNPADDSLGGVSCVGIGDPAQCEAISDQQIYDRAAHKDTGKKDSRAVALSNRGLAVYDEFQEVVVLSNVHRLQTLQVAEDADAQAYNERCRRFGEIMLRLRDMTLTHEDYFWLCKLKRSARSAKDRLFFADAPVLMEFRRTTEANEEDNCDAHNRKHVRKLAADTNVPVVAFDATHAGIAQAQGVALDDALFCSLPKRLELAVGAPVLLMHNIAVEHGLMNGSQGTVVDFVYLPGCHPTHENPAHCLPAMVVVDFPGYTGPAFFSEPSRRTWVPLLPRTTTSDEDAMVSRTQFPLCLAWALTPWKAQGMTLAKVIVKLSHACAKPGVLFVALTRVRHPDCLLLEDDFPAFSVLRRQLTNPSFAARQLWERRMRVFFSRTVRRHMRDTDVYSANACWTDADAALADSLVEFWRCNCDCLEASCVEAFCAVHPGICCSEVGSVWQRLNTYPHVFELAAARGSLSELHMDGTKITSPPVQPPVGTISFDGWTVKAAEMEDYATSNELTESLMQALLITLRDHWPDQAYVFEPALVRNANVSLTLPKRQPGKKAVPEPLPPIACFPYRTTSKHWVLYVYRSGSAATAGPKIQLFKRGDVKPEALDFATKHLQATFAVGVDEQELPDAEYGDLAVLLAATALATGRKLADFQEDAEQAVVAVERFFRRVLARAEATRCSDVSQLALSDPDIAAFFDAFLAGPLPRTTRRAGFRKRPLPTVALSTRTAPPLQKRDAALSAVQFNALAMSPVGPASRSAGLITRLLKRARGESATTPTANEPKAEARAAVAPRPVAPAPTHAASRTTSATLSPPNADPVVTLLATEAEAEQRPAAASAPLLTHGGPEPTTLPAALAPSDTAPDASDDAPRSALYLKERWLDLVLSGQKTWEIRPKPTRKRERIALAQSQSGELKGDVAVVACEKLTLAQFEAGKSFHCVPAEVREAFRRKYAQIYAWKLAAPRRYATPVPFPHTAGQVVFVDLTKHPAVLRALANVSSMPPPFSAPPEPSEASTSTHAPRDAAAAAAEERQAADQRRGIGNVSTAQGMADAAARVDAVGTGDVFGARSSYRLRQQLGRSRAATTASNAVTSLPSRPPSANGSPSTASVPESNRGKKPDAPAATQAANADALCEPPTKKPRLLQPPLRDPSVEPRLMWNVGNTCFLNSLFQALRTVAVRVGMTGISTCSCPLAPLLCVENLDYREMLAVVNALPLWDRVLFGRQHDVHEVARLLLDKADPMHKDCAPDACLATRFHDVFLVHLKNELLCATPHCAFKREPRPDKTLDVQLDVRSADLRDLIDDYEAEEFLNETDDYRCERCEGLVQKRLRISPQGDAVMFHLKRFNVQRDQLLLRGPRAFAAAGRKLSEHVPFPQVLPIDGQRFDFAAVVTHIGSSMGGGHYVACVDPGQLYECNDDTVRRCDWLHVEQQQAYVLMYVKSGAASGSARAVAVPRCLPAPPPRPASSSSAPAPAATDAMLAILRKRVANQLHARQCPTDLSTASMEDVSRLQTTIASADALRDAGDVDGAVRLLRTVVKR